VGKGRLAKSVLGIRPEEALAALQVVVGTHTAVNTTSMMGNGEHALRAIRKLLLQPTTVRTLAADRLIRATKFAVTETLVSSRHNLTVKVDKTLSYAEATTLTVVVTRLLMTTAGTVLVPPSLRMQ